MKKRYIEGRAYRSNLKQDQIPTLVKHAHKSSLTAFEY